MMKEMTIEITNKNCSDIVKRDVNKEIDTIRAYFNTVFVYFTSLEQENERLKEEKARLYAENESLRKQLNLKPKKDESDDLDDIYKKLKELRTQKIKWEEELEKCMSFVQSQYDDLK